MTKEFFVDLYFDTQKYKIYLCSLLHTHKTSDHYVKTIFTPYVESIGCPIPWFLAFDHYDYGRWLSVRASDMQFLRDNEPALAQTFDDDGQFVVHKIRRIFSSMAINQAQEQKNALTKEDVGAVG